MNRELELKDIVGYLPYDLNVVVFREDTRIFTQCIGVMNEYLRCENEYYDDIFREESEDMKPILRPLSDLYKEITNNGSEPFIPIVELAKIHNPKYKWFFDETHAYSTEEKFNYFNGFNSNNRNGKIYNQHQLFDKLHEWKVDYRGLIDAGLAIDCNTLDNNPYK